MTMCALFRSPAVFAAAWSASLEATVVSDRCQRGPICSRGSQLANSSVCTRTITTLTEARVSVTACLPLSVAPSSSLSPFVSLPVHVSAYLLSSALADSLTSLLRPHRRFFGNIDLEPTLDLQPLITLSFLRTAACFRARTPAICCFWVSTRTGCWFCRE